MPDLHEIWKLPAVRGVTRGVTGAVRDVTHVAVGLGVLGVQRVQAQRVAVQKRIAKDPALRAHLEDVRADVARHAGHLDGIVEGAMRQVEATLEPLEAQLPGPVRDAAKRAHAQAHVVRTAIRDRLTAADVSAAHASAADASAADASAADGATDGRAKDAAAAPDDAPDGGATDGGGRAG